MSDQIAMAIENTRLLEQSKAALQDLEAINASGTTRAWKNRLGGQIIGYTYSALGVNPIDITPGNLSRKNTNNEKIVKVPLGLRGKEIGEIFLKRKITDSAWTEAEKEMVERIATQVVLSIENARLLEESPRRAAREQTVNEFSSRFSHSLDVDALLQNAVREIHRLPQVSEVSIFITPTEETQRPE
jgi:GAF domain-containing protein